MIKTTPRCEKGAFIPRKVALRHLYVARGARQRARSRGSRHCGGASQRTTTGAPFLTA
jgi:hypothetical protein